MVALVCVPRNWHGQEAILSAKATTEAQVDAPGNVWGYGVIPTSVATAETLVHYWQLAERR